MKQKFCFTLLAVFLTLGIAGFAYANSTDMSRFNTAYPTTALLNNCSVCHPSVPSLNAYGTAYRSNGRSASAITTIASLDSDGDGFTNAAEITAGFLPGDAASHPAAAADTTGPTLTVTSHTNGQTVTTASITLTGTATDSGWGNSGIQQVTVNGTAATGGTASGTATANWSRALSLNAGTNSITVIAYDNSTAHNTTTQNISVTYTAPVAAPVIGSFTATPGSITSGQSATLAWTLSGGAPTSLSIDNGVGSVLGSSSRSASPTANTTYTLTATNSAGSVTRAVTVTVAAAVTAPVIGSFTATPGSITSGQSATLAWTLSGGAPTTLSINSGVGSVLGSSSRSASPTANTTYILTASNSGGTVSQSVNVTVTPVTPPPPPTGELPSFSRPTQITNTYFPVSRLRTQVLEGTIGGQDVRIVRSLRDGTKSFQVGDQRERTLTMENRVYIDGQLEEMTWAYFGQADDGAVYFFGEDVSIYRNRRVVSREGSWLYGTQTEQLGVAMPADPKVGTEFQVKNVPEITTEDGVVVEAGLTVTVPAGRFRNCLKVEVALSDGTVEYKFYAPNVGVIKEVTQDGEINLVSSGRSGERGEEEEDDD